MNFDMDMIYSQNLILTPKMEYSLKILKLGNEELSEMIHEEILSNPALEYDEQSDKSSVLIQRNQEDADYYKHKNKKGQDDQDFSNEIKDESFIKQTLSEFLKEQLIFLKLDKKTKLIVEFLVESLDEKGYLSFELEEITKKLRCDKKSAEKAVVIIQKMEPSGVGARSLRECLLIQLENQGKKNTLTYLLADKYLEKIADNKIKHIAEELGIEIAETQELIREIKMLNPKPGASFYSGITQYIKPDIVIEQGEMGLVISINEANIPNIKINTEYCKYLKLTQDKELVKYLGDNYSNASWLLKCINQRNDTLEKIAEVLAKQQKDFFEKGKGFLRPLNLKDVADITQMHESTVSRAINDKYLLCKWGLYPLKYFFSCKNVGKNIQQDNSSDSIKQAILSIVKAENKREPLSDMMIVEKLQQEGMKISRRTVAKYRSQLGIMAADKRREYI